MKIVLGIDGARHYRGALQLLAGLKFPAVTVDVVHIQEPLMASYGTAFFPVGDPYLSQGTSQRSTAEALNEEATEAVRSFGMTVEKSYVFGSGIARMLMEHADAERADLIAVGSSGKRGVAHALLGSIGRSLTLGARQSVLVARRAAPEHRPPVVIFATDHSPYADGCARRFAEMEPTGIGRLILLTVVDSDDALDEASIGVVSEFRNAISQRSQRLERELREFRLPAEHRLEEGRVSEAIKRVADDVDADLVVLGAQGHGFWERMVLGSTSLDVVMNADRNVLILRPADLSGLHA